MLSENIKAQASAVSAIDESLLVEFVGGTMAKYIYPSVKIVRELKASLSFCCVSAHPTKILQSPCGTLYVRKVFTNDDGFIVNFNLTTNPKSAGRFSKSWAEKHASVFKNGEGDFEAVAETPAFEKSLIQHIDMVKFMVKQVIDGGATKLTSYDDIQGNYMGEFYKIDNDVLTEV